MAKEKEKNPNAILNVAILTGAEKPERAIDPGSVRIAATENNSRDIPSRSFSTV
jgi:hypothetical protein